MLKRLATNAVEEDHEILCPPFKKMRLNDLNSLTYSNEPYSQNNTNICKCLNCIRSENKIDNLEQKIVELENKYTNIYRRLINTENELDRVTCNIQEELDDCISTVRRMNPKYSNKNESYMDYIN